jgi:hypothetical protein
MVFLRLKLLSIVLSSQKLDGLRKRVGFSDGKTILLTIFLAILLKGVLGLEKEQNRAAIEVGLLSVDKYRLE